MVAYTVTGSLGSSSGGISTLNSNRDLDGLHATTQAGWRQRPAAEPKGEAPSEHFLTTSELRWCDVRHYRPSELTFHICF